MHNRPRHRPVGAAGMLQRVGADIRSDGKSEEVRELVSLRAQEVSSENLAAVLLDQNLVHRRRLGDPPRRALGAAIWHNFQTGQAVSRSLTTYDH